MSETQTLLGLFYSRYLSDSNEKYRFQGSNSISSDMYFNRDTGSGAGGMKQSQSYYSNMQVGASFK